MADVRGRTMDGRDWATLIALSVLWGGSFYFIAVALTGFPPLTLVLLRVGVAALALHLVLRLSGAPFPTSRPALFAFLGMGLLNNVAPFLLLTFAQTALPSGLVSILNATTPLFGVLIAHALTPDEKLTPAKAAGVLLGFAGVVVMIGPPALGGFGGDLGACLACLAAASSYGFAGVFGRRFQRLGVPPMTTAAGMLTASALVMAPVALAVDHPFSLPAPGPAAWAALLGLALISTALAYLLFFRLLARAGATNLLLVTFLIPVTAILLGVWRLGELLQPLQLAGMALIGLGLAAIDGRLWRAARGAAPA